MARVRMMAPLITPASGRMVAWEGKQADPFYASPEYAAWREQVIARAGRRCEALDQGARCTKAEPKHRLFADHIHERSDGGADLDLRNGQCLCGRHHALKTARARMNRARGVGV